MAPRSARKRKSNEGDAGAPNRRKKREDTPMKASGGGGAGTTAEREGQPSLAGTSPPLTPKQHQAAAAVAQQEGLSLSFDPDESQMMGTLDDSLSGEQPEDLFPLMLETQYEEDEDAEDKEADSSLDEALEANVVCTATEADPVGANSNEMADETSALADAALLNGEGDEDEDEDEDEEENRKSLIGASASIEEILQQLAEVASDFMTNYREFVSEGDAIQAELNQLNDVQEARCAKMLGRLERAGNSIFSFGQQPNSDEADAVNETQAGMTQSQA